MSSLSCQFHYGKSSLHLLAVAFESKSVSCSILQIRMLGEEGGKDAAGVHEHGDDVFLKKIESHLLTQASKLYSRATIVHFECVPCN